MWFRREVIALAGTLIAVYAFTRIDAGNSDASEKQFAVDSR